MAAAPRPFRSSLRVATVSGIEVRVHVSFLLILVYGAWEWGSKHGQTGALFGVLLMLSLFFCVVLHELGHSLVAQRFGVEVHEIILLPIGGVSRMEKNPEKPMQELLIALVGPL